MPEVISNLHTNNGQIFAKLRVSQSMDVSMDRMDPKNSNALPE